MGFFLFKMSLNCYDGAVCCSCPEQIWDEINVPNVMTSSVKITGIETCDPATIMNGFQEVEITGAAGTIHKYPHGQMFGTTKQVPTEV